MKLSLRHPENQIVLEIIDTGDGIPAHSRDQLFKPFTKNDNSVPGAGLGLHISRQLVERMSGSLDIDSEVGRGTIFRVLLPCGYYVPVSQTGLIKRKLVTPPVSGQSRLPTISTTTSSANQLSANDDRSEVSPTPEMSTSSSNDVRWLDNTSLTSGQEHPYESPSTDSNHPKSNTISQSVQSDKRTTLAVEVPESLIKVLVVDDNAICRKLLGAGLKRLPIANIVLEAVNGEEAVRIYKEERPDLVITDISMPVMDGVTAAGLMREADLILANGSETALTKQSEHETLVPRHVSPARIYALTGLGSSDPRLKTTALTGFAGLDGWLIKGKANMDAINQIMTEIDQEHKELSKSGAMMSFTEKGTFRHDLRSSARTVDQI